MVTGRLTLSWVGKEQALLNAADGGYEWVSKDDPRVTEVRLLQEVGKTGEVLGTPADNLLIQGDSLSALRALSRIPEYAREYKGKVKLVYIDPPFNTGQAFRDYEDSLEHSVWLTMMRDKLVLIRELLSPDGSVWVHLDDTEMAYCRVMMDEIFGRSNFRNSIIWKRTTSKSSAVRNLGTMHETILFYSASADMSPNKVLAPYSPEYVEKKYSQRDGRGRYQPGDLTAAGIRTGSSGQAWLGFNPTDKGRHWVAPNPNGVLDSLPAKATTQEKLDTLNKHGYIHFSEKKGSWPRFKRYLSDTGGVSIGDVWDDIPVLNSQEQERNSFSTQKPERLLKRIMEVSTDPGDIVLDCFAGSGTTAAVAQKMGRRWITVELLPETVSKFISPRLEKVVLGEDAGGITELAGWSGGGGFRSLRVASSAWQLYEEHVLLADWVKGSGFAAVVAAQLGFAFEGMEHEPFCGRRGRVRLAVVDGVVDEVVAKSVLSKLVDGERMVLVGRGITPESQVLVSDLSPGSKVLKAPRDLIDRRKVVR